MENSKYIVKTIFGLEEVLADEIREFCKDVQVLNRAVSFTGNLKMFYKANLCLRTALSILKPIETFKVKDDVDLYNKVKRMEWSKIFKLENTFAITSTLHTDLFNHTQYVALKTKDAIADHFRDKFGKRPNVDAENPDIKINIHISDNICTISLESVGVQLYKRNYRKETLDAPINEVLAAGMILLSKWNKKDAFIDPMCGSGTIPIEAAMISANIPPNISREKFCFQYWSNYDEKLFENTKEELISKIQKSEARIYASDIDTSAIRIAKSNLSNVYKNNMIDIIFRTGSFFDTNAPSENGIIVMNPPFGERLRQQNINDFYNQIGSTLKHKYSGFSAWILSSNFEALKQIGLKPSFKSTLYNGALECKFQKFDLFRGKRIENLEK